jgi:hypothetical protein
MNINTLIASLEEFLSIKKDYLNGQQTEENYEYSKKHFAQSLNEYIDSHLPEMKDSSKPKDRSRVTTASSIKVADILANAFDGSNMAVIALNNAPSPLRFEEDEDNQNIIDWLEMVKKCREWMKIYDEDWYSKIRVEALK